MKSSEKNVKIKFKVDQGRMGAAKDKEDKVFFE